jgi:hypothetical protein
MAAEYVDGKPCPIVTDLFGTHALSTAFTSGADAKTVRDAIVKLNPTAKVTVES